MGDYSTAGINSYSFALHAHSVNIFLLNSTSETLLTENAVKKSSHMHENPNQIEASYG